MKKICKRMLSSITVILLFIPVTFQAQVKFGENKSTIHAGSLLELESSAAPYKGVLLPRISLGTTTTWSLNGSGVAAMMVYNTNTGITSSNNSYPILPGGKGMYYWDGTGWLGMTYPVGLTNGQYWGLKGNSGTGSGINFLGTTDDHPLLFKVNGQLAGFIDSSSGNENLFLGYQAGQNNSSGGLNVLLGHNAGNANTTSSGNVMIGAYAGLQNQVNNNNLFIGYSSGFASQADDNHFVGNYSGYFTNTGTANMFNGFQAGYSNTTGNNNHFEGYEAGYGNITGSGNLAIGYKADVSTSALSKAGAIGFNAKVSASNSLVLGGTGADAVNIGIGTAAPNELLQLGDNITGPNNPIILLQSGANFSGFGGILRFRETGYPGSNYGMDIRHSTGSAGSTNEGLYFDRINGGTTVNALFIDEDNGRVGIGNALPQQNVHISGTAAVNAIFSTGTNLVTPTVRIDGLNSANNGVHQSGDNEPRPVFATRDGDLVLALSDSLLISNDDFITTTVPISLPGNGTGVSSASATIAVPTFTLTRRALVQINYSVSVRFQLNSTVAITDGIARSATCRLSIVNTTTSTSVKSAVGAAAVFYANTNPVGNTATVLAGYAYTNGNYSVELTAGNYSVQFMATASTGSGVGVYTIFGGGPDMLQVLAHYK